MPSINVDYTISPESTDQRRLTVTVSTATGVDANIFVFQRLPVSDSLTPYDEWIGVASPADLSQYPADDPGTGTYWRSDSAILDFRSTELLERAMDNIQEDIQSLIDALTVLATAGTSGSWSFTG